MNNAMDKLVHNRIATSVCRHEVTIDHRYDALSITTIRLYAGASTGELLTLLYTLQD